MSEQANEERLRRALDELREALADLRGPRLDARLAPLLWALDTVAGEGAATNVAPAAGRGAAPPAAALEARLQDLTRELEAHDAFLGTLAHELRNPLSPIYMQAQYLLEVARQAGTGSISAEWLYGRLQTFCGHFERFVQMLDRILVVSRASGGRMALELETFDLAELVRQTCSSYESQIARAKSSLLLRVPPILVGTWDRLRIEQIVNNLISNAIRYGAGSSIEVELVADAEVVRLSVRDHGIGIAPEDQARIFERFQRATERRQTGGFGIGLWIVRESARALQGTIEVASAPGEGAEFRVTLPRQVRVP